MKRRRLLPGFRPSYIAMRKFGIRLQDYGPFFNGNNDNPRVPKLGWLITSLFLSQYSKQLESSIGDAIAAKPL